MRNITFLLLLLLLFILFNIHIGTIMSRQVKSTQIVSKPISIREIRPYPPQQICVLKIDHDNLDEAVHAGTYHIPGKVDIAAYSPFYLDYQSHFFGEILIPASYRFFEAYYSEKSDTYVFRFLAPLPEGLAMLDIDNRQNRIKTVILTKNSQPLFVPTDIGGLAEPLPVQLEPDQKKNLIILLKSIEKQFPRGVICVDPGSGEILWKYDTGTSVTQAEFHDLDGDKRKEILLSTYSCNNGVERNGTSDYYSYVIVLDSRGNRIWQKITAGWDSLTHVTASDLDNDGNIEVIAATGRGNQRPKEQGRIIIFEGISGRQRKLSVLERESSLSRPFISKMNDGTSRIYVGDSEGWIWMLDKNLDVLKRIKENAPVFVANTSGRGQDWPYLISYTREKLFIYDYHLKEKIFSHPLKPNLPIDNPTGTSVPVFIPLKGPGDGYYGLISSQNLSLIHATDTSWSHALKNIIDSGIFQTTVTFIMFNAFFIFIFLRSRRTIYSSFIKQAPIDTSQFFEIIRGITHQMKNPISTILWTSEKIKRNTRRIREGQHVPNKEFSRLADFLLDDVKKLRQESNNILQLVQVHKPKFQEKNLKSILERITNHYSTVVDERILFKLEVNGDIFLSLDENLFKEAIVNIIENAVDAMPDEGELSISAVPVVSPVKGGIRKVLIEIEDTGRGIDEEDISKLFDPFFTKKESGTGLGLTICKQIIEAHGGTIHVHSRKNFGTKIAITVPAGKGKNKS